MLLLCIDDDRDDVLLFEEVVQVLFSEYTLHVAKNGAEAIQLLKTINPDIIFLDVNMPVMNGRETLKHIRQNSKLNAIPVCMLSTAISTDECKIYLQMGATSCVTKPASFSEFCGVLKSCLTQVQRHRL